MFHRKKSAIPRIEHHEETEIINQETTDSSVINHYLPYLKSYGDMIKNHPRSDNAILSLLYAGNVFVQLGYYKEALFCYDKVIEISPNYFALPTAQTYTHQLFKIINAHEKKMLMILRKEKREVPGHKKINFSKLKLR